ncbi:hypothetical protein BDR26DRAFT_938635 [Obelidium mucronatum]|nr:hypothetical protein BDR26DRAFT_938635 [Obelidium mucronatum]
MVKILSFSSLLVFIVLASTLMGVCGLDLFIQIVSIQNDASGLTKFLFIVGSACAVLIIASVTILSARKFRINSSLSSIPRLHIPINDSDMPRYLYQHVQKTLADSASVRLAMRPLPDERHIDGYMRTPEGHLFFQRLADNNVRFNHQYAQLYISRYEEFAINPNESTEYEYLEFMKIFALLLRSMSS